jgi:ATP-dependent Lhr-like helicase
MGDRETAQPGAVRDGRDAGVDRFAGAERWFATRGQSPFDFQREVWSAMLDGRSGLVHATTGSGKTYAVWIGALARARLIDGAASAVPLQVLWITPMRALASDTAKALREPLDALAPTWTVGLRTGDTPSSERAKQDRRMPSALVTTPESLTLMLTREDARAKLEGVHTVIADEWHELLGSKRGVQLQLALARLRRWNPSLVVWGLSATLGNLDDAMQALTARDDARLVRGRIDKALVIDTLIPQDCGRFGWAGHLGAQMQQPVIDEIERTWNAAGGATPAAAGTTLVFTNVRSQAETWYQLLIAQRPEWAGEVALHHGSLDREVRDWVEGALKEGRLRAVVATSSLDLGVDFLPVERVLQVGSAKGVARLLQRAGRSGHAPGRASRVTLVPTHAFELIEAAAARRAAMAGQVESRESPRAPLDVLVQHLVSVALGGGFEADAMFDEVRTAPAYANLSREAFDWALAFVSRGGESLTAYPEYHRARPDEHGVWRVGDPAIAKRHRMQVGTIVAESSMLVKWTGGGTIGSIEEGFVARLSPGDHFVFAGRVLELVRVREMTAWVRKGAKPRGVITSWAGSRMSLSNEMSKAVLALVHASARVLQPDDRTAPDDGRRQKARPDPSDIFDDTPPVGAGTQKARPDPTDVFTDPEMAAVRGMLEAQARLSRLPREGRLLIERHRSREGWHVFVYPFAGRNVHIGLAQLLAWRLSRVHPNTFSLSVNDHGLELLAAQPVDLAPVLDASVWSLDGLAGDIVSSLGAGNLARKRFREIARIAGLVFGGYPGQPKSARQLQASSSLFFDVFRQYDAGNRLLEQAHEEVLAQELELERMKATLCELATWRPDVVDLDVVSPFALPLMVERFREELSTEKLADRLTRIVRAAQAMLHDPAAPAAPDGMAGAPQSRASSGRLPAPDGRRRARRGSP